MWSGLLDLREGRMQSNQGDGGSTGREKKEGKEKSGAEFKVSLQTHRGILMNEGYKWK